MKFKFIKKTVGLLVLTSMVFSLGACQQSKETVVIEPMEKEEVYKLGFDFLGGDDVMPISGYNGPSVEDISVDGESFPDYITEEIFQDIRDCGVNMIHHTYTNYQFAREQAIKTLELGEKYGVGICISDSMFYTPAPGDTEDLNTMDARISLYCDYPAFCGLYVVDEPGTEYFKHTPDGISDVWVYAPIFQNLRKLDVFGAGNMLAASNEAQLEPYERLLDEYCSTCDPMMLSFDYYPCDVTHSKRMHFLNADLNREYANKYGIPLWVYIQAGAQWNDGFEYFDSVAYYPSEEAFDWCVNAALAYGAKGIEYFPLIQPVHFAYAKTTPYDFQRNGLIGAMGNKTQWWYYAQNINKHIAEIDSVLMNSVNKGVIATGEQANSDLAGTKMLMEGTSWRELKSVKGETMIGCFNFNGKTALYVVNYNDEYAQNISLELQDKYNVSITQNAEMSRISTDTIDLEMRAGEGVLIVFD